MSGDIWVVATGGGDATGIQWMKAKDVAQHSIAHRAALATKSYPAPNVKGAQAEKH